MRTFILTKAYAMQLGNSKADDEKAKYLISLVEEFDERQKEKITMIHELKILPEYL